MRTKKYEISIGFSVKNLVNNTKGTIKLKKEMQSVTKILVFNKNSSKRIKNYYNI